MAYYHEYEAGPDGQLDLLEKARMARDDAYQTYGESQTEDAFALIEQAHALTTRAELTDDYSQEEIWRSRAGHYHVGGRLELVEAIRTNDWITERSAIESLRTAQQSFDHARRASGSRRLDQTEVHYLPTRAMAEAVGGNKREALRFFGKTAVVGMTLSSESPRVFRHTNPELSIKARLLEKAARIAKTFQVFDVLVSPRERARQRAAHYLTPRPDVVAKLVEHRED